MQCGLRNPYLFSSRIYSLSIHSHLVHVVGGAADGLLLVLHGWWQYINQWHKGGKSRCARSFNPLFNCWWQSCRGGEEEQRISEEGGEGKFRCRIWMTRPSLPSHHGEGVGNETVVFSVWDFHIYRYHRAICLGTTWESTLQHYMTVWCAHSLGT